MGRPRGFDEDAALDASAKQFRVYGYSDTSTEQLCKAAGVRRSSLYNAFLSKDELFLRALERHVSKALAQQRATLTSGDLSGIESLEAFVQLALDEEREARKEGHAAGCMVVASRMTPGLGQREPRVQTILDQYHRKHLRLVADAVLAGQHDGSLRMDVAAEDAAHMVVSGVFGLRVLAQSGTAVAELQKAAELHLDSLKPRTS